MRTTDCALAGEIPIEFAADYSAEISQLSAHAARLCNQVLSPTALAAILGVPLTEARKLWDGVSPPPVWMCGAMLIALSRQKRRGGALITAFLTEEIWHAHHRLGMQPAE